MTLFEKLFATGIAMYVGNEIGKNKGVTNDEKKQNGVKGALTWGGATILGCELFAENEDTVNYSLYHKKKKVYDGISFENRLDKRVNEHKCNGKVFDSVVFDDAKPRSAALEIERKRIKLNKGVYNIHHNC